MCVCYLIRNWCDPDEDVEGKPAAEGNLVIPSPILLSSAAAAEEEEEEEEEQTRPWAARHQLTLKRAMRER